MKIMRQNVLLILIQASLIFLGIAAPSGSAAQTKSQPVFVSKTDDELSIKSVTVAPFTDNVGGIYARPLTETARDLFRDDPQWNLAPFPIRPLKVEGLEERTQDARRVLQEASAEALLTGRIVKGPRGLMMRLTLIVGPSALPLLTEETVEAERFELDRAKDRLAEMLGAMRAKMPYRGTVLSRRGQQVTINLGSRAGLRAGSDVSVIQILRLNRHPKKDFMISSDREILGKIRVFKADDELSFGNIIFEKEAGLVVPGMKILPDEVVRYPEPVYDPEGQAIADIANRGDKPVAFGEKPIEWLPEPPPQYGRVQVLAGLGQYEQTVNLQTAGGLSGSNSLAPALGVSAEGWLNADWFLSFDLRQSSFSILNNLVGSSPGKLNVSVSKYALAGGRNFLLGGDFFGPKIQLTAGFGKFAARVDDSTPPAFSNTEYGGLNFGFLFTTPLGEGSQSPWDMGARLRYYWSPGVGESLSSGSADSVSAQDFGVMAGYRTRRNFRYIGELTFEYYNASFSGAGDRTADPNSGSGHRMTSLLLGLEYAF